MSTNSSTAPAKGESSFNQTLQFITSLKLQELDKQRNAHREHAKIIDEAKQAGLEGGILRRVEVLAKGVKKWSGSGAIDPNTLLVGNELHLGMLKFWIQQAKTDPSFNISIAEKWVQTLEDHIRNTAMRFDAAKLFGSLLNEWLASGDSSAVSYHNGPDESDGAASDAGGSFAESFVDVGRREMYEQKEKLMSIVFDAYPIDEAKVTEYLEGLFEEEEAGKALERLRKEMKDHGRFLAQQSLYRGDVINAIKGLLASGLMDEEKRGTMKAFLGNDSVLDEVASVMKMRLAAFDTWAWPEEGILVEMRRALNGKYRAFTDPEIVDALVLQHIGVSWQVKLKTALKRLFQSKAWKRSDPPTHLIRERWEEQTRTNGTTSIAAQREQSYVNNFFLSQLSDAASSASSYDDILDAPPDEQANSFVKVKQQLFTLLTTDCLLNKTLHGTHAVLRSDMEWFGPSLPHQTILSILSFLGMPNRWVSFMKAFLAAPIRFPGETSPRVRKRGTPISYALSALCGEAVLFIMDYAVNHSTNGLNLFRMHDDLWLWDADVGRVAKGWAEMQKFAGLFGVKFNKAKTGSAVISDAPVEANALPDGEVRWGFLKFDPSASRFVVDQEDVDKHIVELRRQLNASRSVFGWVNVYNKYMAFMLRNFGGTPANCFSRDHLNDLITTLARFQREIFTEDQLVEGGVVGYLRKIIQERFGIKDLPEGYFYFPISSGGLELKNIMLELLVLEKRGQPLSTYKHKHRTPAEIAADVKTSTASDDSDSDSDSDEVEDTLAKEASSRPTGVDDWAADPIASGSTGWDADSDEEDTDSTASIANMDPTAFQEAIVSPDAMFSRRIAYDRSQYNKLRERWDLDTDKRRRSKPHLKMDFMSFEDYEKLRTTWLEDWGKTYKYMQDAPGFKDIPLSAKLEAAVEASDGLSPRGLGWYDKWTISLYGDEVVKQFGGLEVVDPNVIPIGMVEFFRTSRINLDQ